MKINENYVKKLIEEGSRISGRGFDKFRKIKIENSVIKTAEGSARVKLGNTDVLVGVKMSMGEPFPDTPDEAILIVSAELVPIASPTFEPGPPREEAIELARVVDRGIRESHCIGLEKLCIKKGEKVWVINVDIHVLDHDGNLIDASAIGAISALLNTKMPKYENEKVIYEEREEKLPVIDIPIAITIEKIAEKLLVDPELREEDALDARITITTNKQGNICAIQKGGEGYFTTQELEKAADLSIEKGIELRGLLA